MKVPFEQEKDEESKWSDVLKFFERASDELNFFVNMR
jgi:hypothetical protein